MSKKKPVTPPAPVPEIESESEDEIKCCPLCGAGEAQLLTNLIAWDVSPFGGSGTNQCTLHEHQCLTCNRSFWT